MVVEVIEEVGVGKTHKKSGPVTSMDFLQNMSNSELAMIYRLAGNDVEVRKATIKKLRKWLKAIAAKVPDSQDSRELIDANFGRVWKAMFYCMWMADKPLPQETLAEQISNFVSIFAEKPNLMLLFIEWFFVTFVREWPWIDRLRLDKFMMLIRRVLRKMLQEFSNRDWEEETMDRFLNILTIHLFNHHAELGKSRKTKKLPDPPKAPLGFQIHIVNIFLEELAKVGGSALESPKILRLMTPFINEMAVNDDQRLLEEIKERLFHHLMKQSDVGIDYVESRGGTMEFVEMDEDEDCDEEVMMEEPKANGALDPRAGQVDVVLPQLDIEYTSLVDMLTSAANQENVKGRNRKILSSLARQFENLTKGQFPLGFKREGTRIPAIKRSEIDAAAQRLIEVEEEMKGSKTKRKNKKKRQLKAQKVSTLNNDTMSSEDNCSLLNDSDLVDNIDENYDDYIGKTTSPKAKKSKTKNAKEASEVQQQEFSEGANPPRKIKKAKRKFTEPIPPVAAIPSIPDPVTSMGSISPKANTVTPDPMTVVPEIKAQKSEDLDFKNNLNGTGNEGEGETYITIRSQVTRKRRRTLTPVTRRNYVPDIDPAASEHISKIYRPVVIEIERARAAAIAAKRIKLGSPNESGQTPTPRAKPIGKIPTPGPSRLSMGGAGAGGTPFPKPPATTPSSSSSVKKRVNFVLDKNLEHPHSDYQDSILRSPAIPYDGAKRPSFGLLKSRSPATPKLAARKRLSVQFGAGSQGTPRRKASDFF